MLLTDLPSYLDLWRLTWCASSAWASLTSWTQQKETPICTSTPMQSSTWAQESPTMASRPTTPTTSTSASTSKRRRTLSRRPWHTKVEKVQCSKDRLTRITSLEIRRIWNFLTNVFVFTLRCRLLSIELKSLAFSRLLQVKCTCIAGKAIAARPLWLSLTSCFTKKWTSTPLWPWCGRNERSDPTTASCGSSVG